MGLKQVRGKKKKEDSDSPEMRSLSIGKSVAFTFYLF